MKNLSFLLIFFSIFCVCISCKPKPREIPPMPDMERIKADIDVALNAIERTAEPQEIIDQKMETLQNQTAICEKDPSIESCDEKTIGRIFLALGDLSFDSKQFDKAAENYQRSILAIFESFEKDQKEHNGNMDINSAEIKKQGEKPNLIAGKAFLEARFSKIAYSDFAEIVRAERRMAEALKKSGKEQEALNAASRAEMGLQKIMEYRGTYEKAKRTLLSTLDQLGAEYQSYEDYIQSWDGQLDVPKL